MTTLLFYRDLLLDLAANYLQGTVMPADAERLEAILRSSPAARDEFVAYCMLHGQLGLVTAAIGPEMQETTPVRFPRTAGFGRSALPGFGRVAAVATALGMAAACLALIVTKPAVVPTRLVSTPDAPQAAAAGSYDDRQLTLVTVASFRDNGLPGRSLTPATLRPVKETAVRSTSGADVSVAKKAVFGMAATDSGTLYEGRVQARLPGHRPVQARR